MPKTDYDEFAEAYSADNEVNLLNGHYERPAILSLAGDVDGRRILDVGCGSGPLSAALRDRGAIMTGFDLSTAIIDLARRRLGEDADLTVADLAKPLPYADAAFDDGRFPDLSHQRAADRRGHTERTASAGSEAPGTVHLLHLLRPRGVLTTVRPAWPRPARGCRQSWRR